MECLTFNCMNILWNGELIDDFSPSRGVRQGDPLSPYIFVLCIERLSYGIYRSVQQDQWKPIRLSRLGTPLSHLFFANDLLLLAEASSEQAFFINSVLEDICLSSVAKVNKSKTQVYFSKNVSVDVAGKLGRKLGYTVTKDLGKYLGMPLLHIGVGKSDFGSGCSGWRIEPNRVENANPNQTELNLIWFGSVWVGNSNRIGLIIRVKILVRVSLG